MKVHAGRAGRLVCGEGEVFSVWEDLDPKLDVHCVISEVWGGHSYHAHEKAPADWTVIQPAGAS